MLWSDGHFGRYSIRSVKLSYVYIQSVTRINLVTNITLQYSFPVRSHISVWIGRNDNSFFHTLSFSLSLFFFSFSLTPTLSCLLIIYLQDKRMYSRSKTVVMKITIKREQHNIWELQSSLYIFSTNIFISKHSYIHHKTHTL